MKSSRLLLFLLMVVVAGGGGGGGGGSESGTSNPVSQDPPTLTLTPVGNNVISVTVNGSTCSAATSAAYPNKPCVTITMCDSSNANCQTINDILLDTGDYGVRIFQQALSQPILTALNLNQLKVGSAALPLYECAEYGDGSTVWGAVAYVTLQSERPVRMPIHVIGSSAGNPSEVCAGTPLLSSPSSALYNGSLGVGFFVQDCGPICASQPVGQYYTCNGTGCTATTVPLSSQVQNPVANLAVDNNGVMIDLPGVPSDGSPSVAGSLFLGIGTRSNNSPAGATAYGANLSGNFATIFGGVSYDGFIDSGSNGLFFPGGTIPTCSGGWFCPPSTLSLSATNEGSSGSPRGDVPFQIANFSTLIASSNRVFSNIGAPANGQFDWGLPFFLGRRVYIGIEDTSSSLGTGPYWAY